MTAPQTQPERKTEMHRDYDACVCGDYRHQHEGGTGRCKMPNDLTHGFKPCVAFRLAPRPPAAGETTP